MSNKHLFNCFPCVGAPPPAYILTTPPGRWEGDFSFP